MDYETDDEVESDNEDEGSAMRGDQSSSFQGKKGELCGGFNVNDTTNMVLILSMVQTAQTHA